MFYTRLNVSQRTVEKYTYMANVFSINTFPRKENKIYWKRRFHNHAMRIQQTYAYC